MRALIYRAPGEMIFTDALEVYDPGPGEIKVKIAASGICHSDLSVVNGTIPWAAPAVLGHEGAGVVEAVGSGVTGLAPGDHVALHTLANCGHCAHCDAGRPTRCRATLGNRSEPFRLDGQAVSNFAATSTFTEYTVVKAQQAVKIDASIPLDLACLIGCGVLTGVGTVIHRADVATGDTAAVFGVGGVGLNVIQGLKLAGAARVVAVDLLAAREGLARDFGATDFVDASKDDAAARIKSLLPDAANPYAAGADWAFECSGSTRALEGAMASLGWGGSCVIVGVPAAGAKVDLPIGPMAYVDRAVMGARYGSSQPHRDIPAYLTLYSQGALKLEELVTQRYRLDQYEAAFHDLETGKLARGVFVF